MSTTLPLPEDSWGRDVAKMLVGWLVGSLVAVALLLTVLRWAFL